MHRGNPAPPGRDERGADHGRLFIGMDETVGTCQNAGMLGGTIAAPAEEQKIAAGSIGLLSLLRQRRTEQTGRGPASADPSPDRSAQSGA